MYVLRTRQKFIDLKRGNKTSPVGEVFRIEDEQRVRELLGNNPGGRKYVDLIGVEHPEKKAKGPKIIIYQGHLFYIGGIETFLYNFTKHYKDRDITIICNDVDDDQMIHLGKYANIREIHGDEKLECDVIILGNYDCAGILRQIRAKKVYQMIHGDLRGLAKSLHWGDNYRWRKDSHIDKIIAVSDTAAEGVKECGREESEVIYNILDNDFKDEDGMSFVTLSRATAEKGINRIVQMAKEFKKAGKHFIWFLCCSLTQADPGAVREIKKIPEFIIVPPTQDNRLLIKSCDYLVQLSDTESFCYSAYEALQRGIPVILTDFPEAQKIVEPGKNGYLVSMDLSDLDIDKIFDHKPTEVSYVDRCDYDKWEKVFKGEL